MDVTARPEAADQADAPGVAGGDLAGGDAELSDTTRGDTTHGDAVPRPSLDEGLARRVADRLDVWRQDARILVAVILVCCAVTGVVWYRRAVAVPSVTTTVAPDRPALDEAGLGPEGAATATATGDVDGSGAPSVSDAAGASATTTDEPPAGPILVHVAGAVSDPGVVEIDAGSRVVDAIESAGGALADADLDRLNLAAVVGDGQRILVARVGDAPTPSEPEGGAAGDDADGALVDLNVASVSELETLPGIGPTLAAAIVEERESRGGFTEIGQLLSVAGIGEQRLANLRDLVTL